MLEPFPVPARPPGKPFPGVGQALLLLLLLWVVLGILGVAITLLFGLDPGTGESPSAMSFLLIAGNTLAFALVSLVGWRFARAPARVVFPFRRFHPGVLIPVAFASVGAVLVGSAMEALLRRVPLPDILDAVMSDLEALLERMFLEAFWPSLFLVVIVAPLTEELFFRGLLLHGFRGRYRPATAILLSALFFGVAHGTPSQLVVGFGAGIFLGWLFLRSGNLWLPVMAHALFNAQPALAARWMVPQEDIPAPTFDPVLLGLGILLLLLGIAATRRFCPPAPPVAPPPQAS